MLSYRHAFHAGNHADVLKHSVLTATIDYMLKKDKPFAYIDSHSGAGMYKLDSKYAAKNAEYKTGISRVYHKEGLPELLATYTRVMHEANVGKRSLTYYPGSPWIAAVMTRKNDRLSLHELHSSDIKLLTENMKSVAGNKAKVINSDGFAGMKALLPPQSKRAVVLIDPPYEDKKDYQYVIKSLKDSIKRFSTGTYMVWYPQLKSHESKAFPDQLKNCGATDWLHVTLSVKGEPKERGMYGSGMFVINPPWVLRQQLEEALPIMKKLMCDPLAGSFNLETHES